MDILFINHFTQVPTEKGNSRFNYIANLACKNGHSVEIVTSGFSHRIKKNRINENYDSLYKVKLINEPGYKRNVSIKRFYSHYVMSKNLSKYLYKRKKPDIIYVSIPSLDVANVATKYAKENNIKLILDIQDIWPEAFKMIFNIPFISDIIFHPMKRLANKIYSRADYIVGVSDTYVKRALEVNKISKVGFSVYLGTDFIEFDKVNDEVLIPKNGDKWLIYIGTLGNSYNIELIIDSLSILKNNGISDLKFILVGDGPMIEKFKSYAINRNVDCIFTGRLDYKDVVRLLKVSDIAVNPIREGTAASIINKVGDYSAASLPVINTQNSKEYIELLKKNNAGINILSGNAKDVSSAIYKLYKNDELAINMGINNRKIGEKVFDRSITYNKIIDLFNSLSDENENTNRK